MPSPPSVGGLGTDTGGGTSFTSMTGSITAGSIVLIFAVNIGASSFATVSGVVGSGGQIGTKYYSGSASGVTGQHISSQDVEYEIWSVPINTGGTFNFTLTYSASTTAIVTFLVVDGAYSTTNYLDPGPAAHPLPAVSTGSITSNNCPSLTFWTSLPDDLIFCWNMDAGTSGGVNPSGFSAGSSLSTSVGNAAVAAEVSTLTVSAIQSSNTITCSPGAGLNGVWAATIVIAFTADAPSVPGQTFVTIIVT